MAERNTKKIDFEAAMARLDEISMLMSKEGISLEVSMALYEEGIKLVRQCNKQLEDTERRINILKLTEDGEMVEEKFSEHMETVGG